MDKIFNITDFKKNDLDDYIKMSNEFYSSSAVDHKIPADNFKITFNECIVKSPFCRGLMIRTDSGEAVGFALLSFTHSNEAGGFVVLLEELFVTDKFRGCGVAKQFFKFLYNEYDKLAARFKLEVTKTNKKAIELYKKLGYEILDYLIMVKDS